MSFHNAVGKPSVAGKAQCPVRPEARNQHSRSERAVEPAVRPNSAGGRAIRRCPCAAPPPRSPRHPAPIGLSAARPPSRAEASRAPGCGRRGMDPQAATGRGPGEPSSQEAPSAEVRATGWGMRALATTRAGNREARALPRCRSPGKRRGRASARIESLTSNGSGRGDAHGPEP